MSDQRASCWSVTINNPKDEEYQIVLPAKWKLVGQLERGEEGTLHYQGMLSTPQVRFAAVKKVFPRAHLEVAKNKAALAKYVQKEETRERKVESIPTLFEYQTIVANMWDEQEFQRRWDEAVKLSTAIAPADMDDVAMRYLDRLVADDIESGRRAAEFIAINPMWRSSWKKFWRSIINRHASFSGTEDNSSPPSPDEEAVRQTPC